MVTHDDKMIVEAGDSIELAIFDLNQHGQGVGRFNGMIVFVDGALPGETVNTTIVSVKKNYAVGMINQLLDSSPDRVDPLCPLAESCGGCAVQHMSYEAQLKWKHEHVAGLFDRTCPAGWQRNKLMPIIGMNDPWYYRGKVQIPFSGDVNKPVAGFYARRSHEIIDGDVCYIQHPIADVVRAVVREYIIENKLQPYNEKSHKGTIRHVVVRTGYFSGQVMVIIVTNEDELPCLSELTEALQFRISKRLSDGQKPPNSNTEDQTERQKFILSSLWLNINQSKGNIVLGDDLRLLFGQEYMIEEILGVKYRVSPRSFFQVNPHQTVVLYQEVLRMADLKGTETVLDLYCGTGSISLLLAREAGFVRGVEIVGEAIDDAWLNAKSNNITNVDFIASAAEKWLPTYLEDGGKADMAVIDPPRKGCDVDFISALCESEIPVLIYVSCNPATLVRDLSMLRESYEIAAVRAVDMFPHSDSVECVVRMEKITVKSP